MLFLKIVVVIFSFAAMEFIAWFAHKFIMHGFLWRLHKDHHQKEAPGFFERNDFFFLIFAVPGIICLWMGLREHFNIVFWIGVGITLYGLAYFTIHDIFIHQRLKAFRKTESVYLKAIRRAHKMHHKHLDKHDGECFGMLWVPMRFFREARIKNTS